MKSRSHRLPPSDPPDDWINGSWTVDCSCGVTFDDGEEMVSCDECGVWVHTRCSRFVKGEASFACHNCKKRSSPPPAAAASSAATAADTEETEVAQLLIELPTKSPPPNPFPAPPRVRLWAEAPLEDRVHVNGVPGGDPALFQGISSSVFTSQLWKCTGYVPKKFNFQYREFSCWDEDENPASRGADVLFSLSKEVAPPCLPVRTLERKQDSDKVLFGGRLQSWGKKERNRVRVFASSKKRKEELGEGKDCCGKKKKARSHADRVAAEFKKRGAFCAAEINKAGCSENGGLQITESDILPSKIEEMGDDGSSQHNLVDQVEGLDHGNKPKHVMVIKASKRDPTNEALRQKDALEVRVKVEMQDGITAVSSKVDVSASPLEGHTDNTEETVKEEDAGDVAHGLKQPKDKSHFQGDINKASFLEALELEKSRNAIHDLNVPDTLSVCNTDGLPDSSGTVTLYPELHNLDVETDGEDPQNAENTRMISCSAVEGSRLQQRTMGNTPEVAEQQETLMSLPSDEHNSQAADKEDSVNNQVHVKITDAMEVGVTETKQHGQAVEESAGSSPDLGNSFEAIHSSKTFESTNGDSRSSQVTPDAHKLVIDSGKDSSSSVAVLSKPPVPTGYKSTNTTSVHLPKQPRLKVSASIANKKDASTFSSADPSTRQLLRASRKSHPKDLDHPGIKSPQTNTICHASVSKGSKDQPYAPSFKASASASSKGSASSGKIDSSQTQNGSTQSKLVSSGSCQKNEKTSQPVLLPPPKLLGHSVTVHPLASASADSNLSDAELAILLHQELNSSPRVPRVPRMRQASGMQLVSQSAPSMLSKRSNSGGRDQVFRRKNKEEPSRDGSRSSHESIDDLKRARRTMSSPNRKYRESDGSTKKDSRIRSPDASGSMKKNSSCASTECETSCQPSFDASGQDASSIRNSPRDGSTDSTHRTLPSLVDEILSSGKCSTYEELCDAVHVHWHKVRKPNGDRYAYSSHSHAVLDVLRNRSEWAHLIDRGPKTNSNKRRRKVDSDAPAEESEQEETKNITCSREVEDRNGETHQEDVPKGKRKARKRRRVELRGQSVEGPHKRKLTASKRSGTHSDNEDNDDDNESSNDVADGVSSEDESQGADVSASTNSDGSK